MGRSAAGPAGKVQRFERLERPVESELAVVARYALLLGIGFGALFVLVLSLTGLIQVIGHSAGIDRAEAVRNGQWGFGAATAIAGFPILRFAFYDGPRLLGQNWVVYRKRLVILVLIGFAAAALGWL